MPSLPGTKFAIVENSTNNSKGNGDCLYHALGNSLQNANINGSLLRGFGPRNRNLSNTVKKLVASSCRSAEHAMAKYKCWTDPSKGIVTVDDYIKKHVMNEDGSSKAWGTNYDVALLALAMEERGIGHQHRLVIYYTQTRKYMWIHPVVVEVAEDKVEDGDDGESIRKNKLGLGRWLEEELQPCDVHDSDVVICNRGNIHWSPTKHDACVEIGQLDKDSGKINGEGSREVISIDSDNE